MDKNLEIWKQLGLDQDDVKDEPKVSFTLKDPASGADVEFKSQEDMNAAVAHMFNKFQEDLKKVNAAAQPPAPAEDKKVDTKNPNNWSNEEKAQFAVLSEEDPVRAADFLFQRTETARKQQEEIKRMAQENEQLKYNIGMAQFIQSKPELSAANPNRAEAYKLVGAVLQNSGMVNPSPVQLDMALNYAKTHRPDLFQTEQRQPQTDQWGNQIQPQSQEVNPWSGMNQPSGRPNNPPVPPRTGNSGFASPTELQILSRAFEKSPEDGERAWSSIFNKYVNGNS